MPSQPEALGGPPTGRRGPPRAVLAGVGAVVLALGALGAKYLIGFLAASVVAGVVASAFGGSWERLPASTRESLGARLEAAVGDDLKDLSEAEAGARVKAMVRSGLPRLDDAALTRRLRLQTTGLGAASEQACATFARSSIGGEEVDDATARAIIDALSTDELAQWFEVVVSALEAEAHGAPPIRNAAPEASDALFQTLTGAMAMDDIATIEALTTGVSVTDTAACHLIRDLYGRGLQLGEADVTTLALIDVLP